MKPLLSEDRDTATLEDLGRASAQIIHDIKNQLNGLKLYATFLRRRIEKSEEFSELQDPLGKLIGGIDRAADDLNVLVRYGRSISLSKHKGVDLQRLIRAISAAGAESERELVIETAPEGFLGDFDPAALSEAFRAISRGALKTYNREIEIPLTISLKRDDSFAVIEWGPVKFNSEDPFRSFASTEAIHMSLGARIIEAHGGSAEYLHSQLRVRLPLISS
jgi:nitrogen fixation/metabolism regulation signal transduction histidine kinase